MFHESRYKKWVLLFLPLQEIVGRHFPEFNRYTHTLNLYEETNLHIGDTPDMFQMVRWYAFGQRYQSSNTIVALYDD